MDELYSKDPSQTAPATRVCRDMRSPEHAGGDIIQMACLPRTYGRFLSIYKEGTTEENQLILCQVEVLGEPYHETRGNYMNQ